jgi:Flp pilus assembly pilin Flp
MAPSPHGLAASPSNMRSLSIRFFREQHGQDLIEYGLLVSFVAILTVGAMHAVGLSLNDWWTDISGKIEVWW